MFTVQLWVSFWGALQHEPLLVAIALPLSHVPSYRGPWLAKGTLQARKLVCELEAGFKFGKDPGHTGLSELDGSLCGLWGAPKRRSGHLLQEFLCWARRFPPCMNVWCGDCYRESPTDPFPRMEEPEAEDESEVLMLSLIHICRCRRAN